MLGCGSRSELLNASSQSLATLLLILRSSSFQFATVSSGISRGLVLEFDLSAVDRLIILSGWTLLIEMALAASPATKTISSSALEPASTCKADLRLICENSTPRLWRAAAGRLNMTLSILLIDASERRDAIFPWAEMVDPLRFALGCAGAFRLDSGRIVPPDCVAFAELFTELVLR